MIRHAFEHPHPALREFPPPPLIAPTPSNVSPGAVPLTGIAVVVLVALLAGATNGPGWPP